MKQRLIPPFPAAAVDAVSLSNNAVAIGSCHTLPKPLSQVVQMLTI